MQYEHDTLRIFEINRFSLLTLTIENYLFAFVQIVWDHRQYHIFCAKENSAILPIISCDYPICSKFFLKICEDNKTHGETSMNSRTVAFCPFYSMWIFLFISCIFLWTNYLLIDSDKLMTCSVSMVTRTSITVHLDYILMMSQNIVPSKMRPAADH